MTYDFDPELVDLAELNPPVVSLGNFVAMRESLLEQARSIASRVDLTTVDVTERRIPGHGDSPDVVVHIYRSKSLAGPVPCVLRIHGGGFVVGSVLGDLPLARYLATHIDAVVVSVEYRLAPEDPYPAGLHDCFATFAWIHDNASELGIDRDRVAIFGTSAGAGLGAGVTLMNRDREEWPLRFLLLDVPELDDRLDTSSMKNFDDTPVWHRPNAVLSWKYYLGDLGGSGVPYYASPARASQLSGFPRTYISVMEFDPLRDEGIEFAKALLEAGVHVELHLFPGTFHGSVMATKAKVSIRIVAEMVETLKRELGS